MAALGTGVDMTLDSVDLDLDEIFAEADDFEHAPGFRFSFRPGWNDFLTQL